MGVGEEYQGVGATEGLSEEIFMLSDQVLVSCGDRRPSNPSLEG